MSQSAAQKHYCKFKWVYLGEGKKSKVLQKLTTSIYNLGFYHYSGVLHALVEILSIYVNKLWLNESLTIQSAL